MNKYGYARHKKFTKKVYNAIGKKNFWNLLIDSLQFPYLLYGYEGETEEIYPYVAGKFGLNVTEYVCPTVMSSVTEHEFVFRIKRVKWVVNHKSGIFFKPPENILDALASEE